nr:hypothetical protein [Staphylococcus aureus]
MNQYHSNAQQPSAWRFFVYSLVGILCFFIPFTINGIINFSNKNGP